MMILVTHSKFCLSCRFFCSDQVLLIVTQQLCCCFSIKFRSVLSLTHSIPLQHQWKFFSFWYNVKIDISIFPSVLIELCRYIRALLKNFHTFSCIIHFHLRKMAIFSFSTVTSHLCIASLFYISKHSCSLFFVTFNGCYLPWQSPKGTWHSVPWLRQ